MSPPPRQDVTALILAAGSGERLGGVSKAFLRYRGRTLIEHVADLTLLFCGLAAIALRREDHEKAREILGNRNVTLIDGGATRRDSVARLLERVDTEFVLLHEIARPFVSTALIESVLAAAGEHAAAVACLPFTNRDSVAERSDGLLARTLVKDRMITIQTPQAYRTDILRRAYDRAAREGWPAGTPDSELVRRAGFDVKLVAGEPGNVKLTVPKDLDLLEAT